MTKVVQMNALFVMKALWSVSKGCFIYNNIKGLLTKVSKLGFSLSQDRVKVSSLLVAISLKKWRLESRYSELRLWLTRVVVFVVCKVFAVCSSYSFRWHGNSRKKRRKDCPTCNG